MTGARFDCTALPDSQVEALHEALALFAKRHRNCGQLWLDVPHSVHVDAMPRLVMACLCGDTFEQILRTPTVSRGGLLAIVRSLSPAEGSTSA